MHASSVEHLSSPLLVCALLLSVCPRLFLVPEGQLSKLDVDEYSRDAEPRLGDKTKAEKRRHQHATTACSKARKYKGVKTLKPPKTKTTLGSFKIRCNTQGSQPTHFFLVDSYRIGVRVSNQLCLSYAANEQNNIASTNVPYPRPVRPRVVVCCCCSHINSSPQHNAARGRRAGSNNSGLEEIPRGKKQAKNSTHDN